MTETELSQLNREVATHCLSLPTRVIPAALLIHGDILRAGSPLWTQIIQEAIDANLTIQLTGAYKGLTYSADFRGWTFTYHVSHSEAYRADSRIVIDGTPNCWCSLWGEDLDISVAAIPESTKDIGTAWAAWETFKKPQMAIKIKTSQDGHYEVGIVGVGVLVATKGPLNIALCQAIMEAWRQENSSEQLKKVTT